MTPLVFFGKVDRSGNSPFSCDRTGPLKKDIHTGWSETTGRMGWMAHRKWKEAKQLPGTAVPGNMLGCCLIYFHFLWAIHPIRPAHFMDFIFEVPPSCPTNLPFLPNSYQPKDNWAESGTTKQNRQNLVTDHHNSMCSLTGEIELLNYRAEESL